MFSGVNPGGPDGGMEWADEGGGPGLRPIMLWLEPGD